jgi:hypothetical protein
VQFEKHFPLVAVASGLMKSRRPAQAKQTGTSRSVFVLNWLFALESFR